jgi:hypothetical protein
MASLQEYSLLSASIYNDARGVLNQLDVSSVGWTVLSSISDTSSDVRSVGLSIAAYQKGNEIVIACKGTDFLIGTNTPQTVSDLLTDISLGLGMGSSQLF